jgi:signal transduction histidine kinase/PAS domain-containing protein
MSVVARYGFAALAVLAGTVGLQAFNQVVDVERAPFFLFTPSVLVAAIVGGLGPGVFATFLGSLAVELILISSQGGQGPPELARLTLFVAVGIGISVLAGRLKEARRLAEDRAREANLRADELAIARAAAERHAREAERRATEFEALFAVSPVGIARADDAECRHVTVNPNLAERLGLADAANASLSAPADDRPPLRAVTRDGRALEASDLPLQRAARTRQPVLDAEFDMVRDDGRLVTLHAHAVPLLDERGGVRGALGVFTDVTAERRAASRQAFLDQATQLLNSSLDYESTLSQLVSLAVPAIADWSALDMTDAAGVVHRVGQRHRDPARQIVMDRLAADRLSSVHLPADAVIARVRDGRPVVERGLTADRLRALGRTEEQIRVLVELGTACGMVVPLMTRGGVVGAFVWARDAGRPAFDDDDVGLALELARRASTAVENAMLYREAQTASRQRDEFLATLSHELRTPLNALLGWTDLLRSGRLTPERTREAIEAIHRTATAQAQLTYDLVDVSRAVSGKFELSPREVEIGHLVRAAVETLRLAAEAKGLWLRCHVESDLPRAVVDPDRVRQIAYNLVGNAVKFTSSGGVDVTTRLAGDWVEIAVSDTGVGIDAAFLPYVFDRFRQADGSVRRSFGGLGLGLSIARALVELHGGTVAAASDGDGRGATFTVRLPLAPPAPRRQTDVPATQSV